MIWKHLSPSGLIVKQCQHFVINLLTCFASEMRQMSVDICPGFCVKIQNPLYMRMRKHDNSASFKFMVM